MIVTIHQPNYFPYPGYFAKMDKADHFVFLDNVQFEKNEWQNRNRIKSSQGWQWLTVPVLYKFPSKMFEVKVNRSTHWRKKHIKSLRSCYSRAPFYKEVIKHIEHIYSFNWDALTDLNIAMNLVLARKLLDIETEFHVASQMNIGSVEHPDKRIIEIVRGLGGDTYLAGVGGRSYMDLDLYKEKGIEVVFQDFKCPSYKQLFGPFIPNLSVLDLLFNCGPESLSFIRKGNG